MEEIIKNYYGNGGLIIGIMILTYFINKTTPIFKDLRLLFINWFNLDNNKRIKSLSENLNNKKKEDNNELREILEYEIDSLIYTNLTGYSWNRDKQLIFLEFYNKIKHEISLKRFKVLYSNCTINKDKIVSISITSHNKSDLFFKYFLGVFLLVVFLWTLILNIKYYDIKTNAKIILSLITFGSLISGIIFVTLANKDRWFFKMIKKKYHNYQI